MLASPAGNGQLATPLARACLASSLPELLSCPTSGRLAFPAKLGWLARPIRVQFPPGLGSGPVPLSLEPP